MQKKFDNNILCLISVLKTTLFKIISQMLSKLIYIYTVKVSDQYLLKNNYFLCFNIEFIINIFMCLNVESEKIYIIFNLLQMLKNLFSNFLKKIMELYLQINLKSYLKHLKRVIGKLKGSNKFVIWKIFYLTLIDIMSISDCLDFVFVLMKYCVKLLTDLIQIKRAQEKIYKIYQANTINTRKYQKCELNVKG
ncbi:hypothetical protein RFI_34888 [Reticulomyxa filosa]|uniref:Uncharacterized protein n=1 Tax=Reticulomyxa filosa TaxID=46433 RepID=X6LP78_RETFI|nr:hypothetical protein RFI_34888 [Reticulomyxa filosa]|eukprot:ETO02540.1 hypothetical protein RFI_34888 [Reticulomyxa filosa]